MTLVLNRTRDLSYNRPVGSVKAAHHPISYCGPEAPFEDIAIDLLEPRLWPRGDQQAGSSALPVISSNKKDRRHYCAKSRGFEFTDFLVETNEKANLRGNVPHTVVRGPQFPNCFFSARP